MLICASVNDTITMHVGKSVLQQEALLFVNTQQQNQQVYHSLYPVFILVPLKHIT